METSVDSNKIKSTASKLQPSLQKPGLVIGTAGWNIPSQVREAFPQLGTHLQKYAHSFAGVEINSSFYRDHKRETYVRWAASVPAHFRFSVKLSRHFTQETRLEEYGPRLQSTLEGISGLGEKWGCLLVQLPPSLAFEPSVASDFIEDLRRHYEGRIAWEPRHPSWATRPALQLLLDHQIHKVMADPEPCPLSENMKALAGPTFYFRFHGSPEIYRSRYSEIQLKEIKNHLTQAQEQHSEVWCIFDNTTYGFATENASELMTMMAEST